jgi:Flp pilus assembly pilin Flp
MRGFGGFLHRFLTDESGQSAVEYILVLSVAAIGALTIVKTLMSALGYSILSFGGKFEKNLKTGRAPLDVWVN